MISFWENRHFNFIVAPISDLDYKHHFIESVNNLTNNNYKNQINNRNEISNYIYTEWTIATVKPGWKWGFSKSEVSS